MSSLSGSGLPANGDILIIKETAGKKVSFVLSVVPNPAQIRCETYDDAIGIARRWAATRDLTIWFSDDGRTFSIASPSALRPSRDMNASRRAE